MTADYSVEELRRRHVPSAMIAELETATARYQTASENLKSKVQQSGEVALVAQEANDAWLSWKEINQEIAFYLREEWPRTAHSFSILKELLYAC